MSNTNYIMFKGAIYRKVKGFDTTMPPGKVLKWGPDEWPSDEYMESMPEKPPLTREEYEFLVGRRQELEQLLTGDLRPDERRKLFSDLKVVNNKILETRAWLSARRPDVQRLRHWAAS